jgi:hypothetical protein
MNNYKRYFIKSLGLKENGLPGGIGDYTDPTEVDQNELELGIKVEMEHTHDPNLAKEIALDHLTEDPKYYTKIENASNGCVAALKISTPSKIISPLAMGMAVRGTTTGLLPAGGVVGDPVRARFGGFEPIQNIKPNSKGAIADTPIPSELSSPGGHYTPKQFDLEKPTAIKEKPMGEQHPMQVQQIGNVPISNDGTGRDGIRTPSAAEAGVGDEGIDDNLNVGEDIKIDIKENFEMVNRFKKLANISK